MVYTLLTGYDLNNCDQIYGYKYHTSFTLGYRLLFHDTQVLATLHYVSLCMGGSKGKTGRNVALSLR